MADKGTPQNPYHIAVAGASDVGKSTWISRLLGRERLAGMVCIGGAAIGRTTIRCATSAGTITVVLDEIHTGDSSVDVSPPYDYTIFFHNGSMRAGDYARAACRLIPSNRYGGHYWRPYYNPIALLRTALDHAGCAATLERVLPPSAGAHTKPARAAAPAATAAYA